MPQRLHRQLPLLLVQLLQCHQVLLGSCYLLSYKWTLAAPLLGC
jgi:hypothetical protein